MPSALLEWYPEPPADAVPVDDLAVDADRRMAALARSIVLGSPCSCAGHLKDAA